MTTDLRSTTDLSATAVLPAGPDPSTTRDLPLADLRAALTGDLVEPGDAAYAVLATPWNVAVSTTPVAVVAATGAADVAAAVRFAAAHDLAVDVRCTGHAPMSTHRPTLLVHTAGLDELTVDPVTRTARVGAGVRWDAVIAAAGRYGLAAPAGSAPGVGVVGYLTGGGVGPVARTFGVSSDLVTAFDVVTGDGRCLRATATEHPALFWGLRGGKGALGVVTAVEFELPAVSEVFGGTVFFHGDDTADVLAAWTEWTRRLPEQGTTSLAVMRLPEMPGVPEPLAGTVTVAIRFAWVGEPGEGRAAIEAITGSGRVVLGGMGVMPYTAIGSIHNDPVDPMPTVEASGILRDLPTDAVAALVALAGPDAECPQLMVELRHFGGALRRRSSGRDAAETSDAFDHRDAGYSVLAIGLAVPPLRAAVEAHADALLTALAPWSDGGCLPNFAPSADPARVVRSYAPATLARLGTLAATYDPHRVLLAAEPLRGALSWAAAQD